MWGDSIFTSLQLNCIHEWMKICHPRRLLESKVLSRLTLLRWDAKTGESFQYVIIRISSSGSSWLHKLHSTVLSFESAKSKFLWFVKVLDSPFWEEVIQVGHFGLNGKPIPSFPIAVFGSYFDILWFSCKWTNHIKEKHNVHWRGHIHANNTGQTCMTSQQSVVCPQSEDSVTHHSPTHYLDNRTAFLMTHSHIYSCLDYASLICHKHQRIPNTIQNCSQVW